MVFPLFLFTTKERLFRSIDKTSRKGPTKCVAKEKTEWNDQSWALLRGFWIINYDEDTQLQQTKFILRLNNQHLRQDGFSFARHIKKQRRWRPCWCHFVHLLQKTLSFVDEQCLYIKNYTESTPKVHLFYILMVQSIPSVPIPLGHLSNRPPLPPERWSFAFLINCLFVGGEFVIVEFHTFYMQILKRNISYLKNTSTQVTVIAEDFIEKLSLFAKGFISVY